MAEMQVQHPAEFRRDATLAGLGMARLFGAVGLILGGLALFVVMLMIGAAGWKMFMLFLTVVGGSVELVFGVYRRMARVAAYALRPRDLRADASRPVTLASEGTVQTLVKVKAISGPFVHFEDGYLATVLRIQPAPTSCLEEEQEELLAQRFQAALKRAHQAKVEIAVYVDVEPALRRVELERHQRLADRWPEGVGVRRLLEARLAHHQWRQLEEDRQVAYHMRLAVSPTDVPLTGTDPAARTEQVVAYLREVALGIAGELGGEGIRVQPLGPEGIRDLATRQLDPAGWREAEPTRGTDWADPPVLVAVDRLASPVPVHLPQVALSAVAASEEVKALGTGQPGDAGVQGDMTQALAMGNPRLSIPSQEHGRRSVSATGYPLGYYPQLHRVRVK